MAAEREILDKVGKYNLSEIKIISYRQDKEESLPKTIDIKADIEKAREQAQNIL